ncbi:MAG: hypothetical protein IPO00_09830 [Betaproteobacteria bacterium]|nr:hypothetical protein [Betaproteobacteria bacterium]
MAAKQGLFQRMLANPPKGIDALLVEGSSLGRIGDDQHFPSESDIEAQLTDAF